jgi:hypothetical protein
MRVRRHLFQRNSSTLGYDNLFLTYEARLRCEVEANWCVEPEDSIHGCLPALSVTDHGPITFFMVGRLSRSNEARVSRAREVLPGSKSPFA